MHGLGRAWTGGRETGDGRRADAGPTKAEGFGTEMTDADDAMHELMLMLNRKY